MTHAWDPERYLTYADERGRPFVELLARIGASSPRLVADLGCGPGNLTQLLKQRWPDAGILGLDSSPEMIAKARERGDGVRYEVTDVRELDPDDRIDVLISNATFQWVPGHLDLLPSLAARVQPGGWFAFSVPGNFEEPSHTVRQALEAEPPYARALGTLRTPLARPSSYDATTYLRTLRSMFTEVDAWETTYLHVLHGEDPVFTWISGTSARPALAALDPLDGDLRPRFEAELKERLRAAYPDDGAGVVLAFRRIFFVGRR